MSCFARYNDEWLSCAFELAIVLLVWNDVSKSRLSEHARAADKVPQNGRFSLFDSLVLELHFAPSRNQFQVDIAQPWALGFLS